MKDGIQSCHLTKVDAFGVKRNEVIDLETWFKLVFWYVQVHIFKIQKM